MLRLEGDGISQLLRRLPVIAVEDALPPPRSFAILVWLMAAHAKGFTLGRAHVDEVMSFARAIAATRARDDSPQDDGGGDGDGPRLGDDGLATGGGDMVRAMLLRAAFGGMEGDIAMLHRAAATWQRRWARAEAAWADGLAVAFGGAAAAADGVMSGEAPLMVTDIPPAAVDFHCSSVLESVLEQPAVRDALLARGGGDIDGLAQRAMWKCSSGVSRKAPIRAGDHLGHWVVAGAVAEAEAAGDDDGGSGGASGSVAAAWSILREPCAAFARKLVAGKLRRGAGPAVAPLAPQLRPPPPRAATDGASTARRPTAHCSRRWARRPAPLSAPKCCRGRGRRRRTRSCAAASSWRTL